MVKGKGKGKGQGKGQGQGKGNGAYLVLRHMREEVTESSTERYNSQFQNKCLAAMWSGSEEGYHLRLIDSCITQL